MRLFVQLKDLSLHPDHVMYVSSVEPGEPRGWDEPSSEVPEGARCVVALTSGEKLYFSLSRDALVAALEGRE